MTRSPRQRRLLLLLLAVFALLGAACAGSTAAETGSDDAETDAGSSDGSEASASDEATSDSEEANGEGGWNLGLTYDIGGRGDQSFNDSAAAGADQAVAELDITVSEAEPNTDGSDRAELLQLQADQSPLVVAVGYLFEPDVQSVAPENPEVNFAVIDSAMLDFDNGGVPFGDNIAGLTFAEEQGSFLVGAAAALKTETGTLGFIGGVSGFGLIEKFEAGFIAGAKAVDPDITVVSQYITEFPDDEGFYSADRAKQIALEMYGQDADIIYHAAGGSGAGLFEAAKEQSESSGSKVWAIGVDSDQYNLVDPSLQEYVLTSMLKRVDVAVFEVATAQANGEFTAGNTVYDLSSDGVGYSTTGGFIDDIVDQLEDFKTQIVSGEIVVPTDPADT